MFFCVVFFFQAEDGIRDRDVTGVQTCALPISTLRFDMNDSVSARPVRDRLWSALGGSGDLARAVVIGVVQVAVTYLAAHNQPERRHLGLLGSALLAAGRCPCWPSCWP